ncbi:hypothetical protein GOBAR_AA23922 [Gossypium barbadense]|uniref:Pectate lyase superfamily protein domain-containing protein n=1 Tax=Gossypium barbadense TaxID=3634 RepID=A0A2P5X076_GOSBA|nr:hypothetical protein GOBAR_AA23922 [Gossypium barbadense]
MAPHLNIVLSMFVLLLLFISASKVQSDAFDVVAKFGAKADGKTDLSKVSSIALNFVPQRDIFIIKSKLRRSKVKLSNISFKNIRGTSALPEAIKFICSGSSPCQNVELADIDIKHNEAEPATSQCLNVKPITSGKLNPIPCSGPVPKTPSATA